jgi:MoxR-like ATPase
MGYPDPTQEIEIMNSQMTSEPIADLEAVATPVDIVKLQQNVRKIYVDDLVKEYIVTLSNATRDHSDIALGVSPRASLAMLRGSQAVALMDGREYVIPDDIKTIAVPVMSHRLILTPASRMREATGDIIISEILDATPVPGASAGRRPTAESTA